MQKSLAPALDSHMQKWSPLKVPEDQGDAVREGQDGESKGKEGRREGGRDSPHQLWK